MDRDDAAPGSSPLEVLDAAIDGLFESGLVPVSAETAAGAVAELERLARRVHAAQIELMDQIDRRGMHRGDGHATVKVLARHAGKLSNGEALDRHKTMRMLRELPQVKTAFQAGSLGVDQVQLLARVHANPRVQGAPRWARAGSSTKPRSWTSRCSKSGSANGNASLTRTGPSLRTSAPIATATPKCCENPIDLSWDVMGKYAAMQGAAMHEI